MAKKKNMIIHDDDVKVGDCFTIPKGLTYRDAISILERKEIEAETIHSFAHEFRCKMYEGAYAMMMVLKNEFGITLGKGQETFFGSTPPQSIDVKISPTEKVQVPWGAIEVPSLEKAVFQTFSAFNEEIGTVFLLNVSAKRKFKNEVESVFAKMEEFLAKKSFYRGKALIGHEVPDFIDMSDFEEDKVIYSKEAREILETTLWAPIRLTELFRKEKLPRKRAVLLYGPYGTGKTLTGQLTAKIATDNGWTFIAARPGRDALQDTMRTARMYLPAVVFFEDVDTSAKAGIADDGVSEMLDIFDGITSKGGELIVVMTTNHIEKIHKAMFRPGRLDAMIEIGALDKSGIEQLIRTSIHPDKLDKNINFDNVYKNMEGFFPAFAKEAINRAASNAVSRTQSGNYIINEEDIRIASLSLRPQLEQMELANTDIKTSDIDTAFSSVLKKQLLSTRMVYSGDDDYELVVHENGHKA